MEEALKWAGRHWHRLLRMGLSMSEGRHHIDVMPDYFFLFKKLSISV